MSTFAITSIEKKRTGIARKVVDLAICVPNGDPIPCRDKACLVSTMNHPAVTGVFSSIVTWRLPYSLIACGQVDFL